jgi:hypothetical protein
VNNEKPTPPKLPQSIYSQTESPTKDEVEFEMVVGRLVFILQDTEQGIRFCESIVFNPKGDQISTDVFQNDKRSLGRLVEKLKQKTSLDSGFQSTLEAFVKNRNDLIHRAAEQPWWPQKNEGQFADAFTFLGQLLDQAETVKLTFEAVIFDYMQNRFSVDETNEALEPFKKSGYLDALKAYLEFSRAAIQKPGPS